MFGPTTPRSRPQPGHVYDVAVVGAGLAGTELTWRLARAGADVLLVSQALDHLGNLYQPTVDAALFPPESVFAQVARRLAPDADGAPLDGWHFHRVLKAELEATSGIHLLQSCVRGVTCTDAGFTLATWEGPSLHARTLVLAAGSFLRARLRLGAFEEEAGRLSEVAYDFLADDLTAQGVPLAEREDAAHSASGAPAYTVRYSTFTAGDLDGFAFTRWPGAFAVGRCTPGEHTYASVLTDAARLADHLTKERA
ncbi:FAD-dependent oxidoreductase [Deinococcus maricopensis]|uniref:Glucose-inhibited division protein A n=1 Tax=Deinococcus maricopensis (strain DSM 21211 / LMG 22137 / NRRL B-23946 / LB-34) TaxID=709986 RepID=E8UBP8_DEIML|nr:FAD-dependent oxidoreductase [Deinococcus maricopensis]ADV68487.1 glucose-inhibited division protein A [Deinococcus maricopensis DSM 21211]